MNKQEHKSHIPPFYCQKAISLQIWPSHNRTKQRTTNSWPMNWHHLLDIFDGVLVRRMIAFYFFAALMRIILFFDATIMIISLQNKHCQWW
jgi:hypothetical protein